MPRDAMSDAIITEHMRKYFSLANLPTVGGFEEVVYVINERAFYVYTEGGWEIVGPSGGGGSTTNLNDFDTGDLSEGSNLYYTNARADDRITAAVGVSIAAANHNHDSRYYTEGEVDTFLAGKIDVSAIGVSVASLNTPIFVPSSSGNKGLIIKGAASQTANLLELQNNNSVVLSSFDKDGYGFNVERTFLLAVGTPATTGVDKTNQVIMTRSGKFLKAFINAKTGPTGADFIVDINRNGTSIWSTTQANRLKIVAGETTGTQTAFDTVNFVEGDVITIDVDQVGSTIAGQEITCQVLCLCRNGAA